VRSIVLLGFCLIALAVTVPTSAQQATQPAHALASQPPAEKLPGELRIPAILKTTLSTKKSKVGDPVKLEVSADVRDAHGVVLIPRHARLTGRVTKAIRYKKNDQAAMLSFVVERAEWRDRSAILDAPVYGAEVLETDLRQGETVGDMQFATLGVSDPLNIVDTQVMSDTRSGSVGAGYAHAVRDAAFHTKLMQLQRVPDPEVRSLFMKLDGDFQVPSEFVVVCLNGMKGTQ
jgi:hypothetical protein